MTVFAQIRSRSIVVSGSQRGGWSPVADSAPHARKVAFRVEITDDGSGHFLLVYESLDGSLFGDTWHKSLEDAYASAETYFGVTRNEWRLVASGA